MSTKTTTPRRNPTRTRDYLGTRALGFSLVELIVGMSIAVLCIGVIYQTMANSSRTVSFAAGATDADTSAKMTLYMLEEQINRSGFGLTGFGSTAPYPLYLHPPALPRAPVMTPYISWLRGSTTLFPNNSKGLLHQLLHGQPVRF